MSWRREGGLFHILPVCLSLSPLTFSKEISREDTQYNSGCSDPVSLEGASSRTEDVQWRGIEEEERLSNSLVELISATQHPRI